MIILGIDPGTRITGYGLIRVDDGQDIPIDYGCIRPKASMLLTERYHVIFEGVSELIERHKPQALAVESQFVRNNPQSALKLGMARGAALIAATQHGIPIYEYAPTKAKLAVVGTGKASKQQVQGMVRMLLRLSTIPQPEDAADALALALCHAHASRHNWCHKHQI